MTALRHFATVLAVGLFAAAGRADEPVRLAEDFAPGVAYRVDVSVKLGGRLALPTPPDPKSAGKPATPPKVVDVVGMSRLVYDERVLTPDDAGMVKTARSYREVDFKRTVGPTVQDAGIRPAVRRMVVIRSGGRKAPFSPDGPLTWGEIDVVRTDVFAPAAVPGLLPTNPVRPGQSWRLSPEAVAELTDMEKVTKGDLQGTFVAVTSVGGRRVARLELSGAVDGVNEDGPTRHTVSGTAYFDLAANALSYLSVKGTHELLDGKGQVVGRVEGQFVMTRTLEEPPADLADAALRVLSLRPDGENTLLLYDNPDLGVRFLHPRGWRVGVVQGRQVTVDHARLGGGLLVTLEPAATVPTADEYIKEVAAYLKKEQATGAQLVDRPVRVRESPGQLDRFAVEAEMGGERVRLEYAILKQPDGGATAAARLPAVHAAELRPEVERIVRSVAVTKAISSK